MIETARLLLIPATTTHLTADLAGRDALTRALGADVPPSWPPDLYDDDAIGQCLRWLHDHPDDAGWGLYYVVRLPVERSAALLIGAGGFKGAPDPLGTVEIGYGVVRDQLRRGYASEALRGWLTYAFAAPGVHVVVGHTLPHLTPSIGVMVKAGFQFAGEGSDPHAPPGERVVRYELSRTEFERT
jgi:ribosomal-protein-alanine N-acetyltransferase